MSNLNVCAHTSYIGVTGLNNHFRHFLRELSKHCNLKARNFTVGETWGGNNTPHDKEPYLTETDKKILYKQTLWDNGVRKDYSIYEQPTEPFDVNLVIEIVDGFYFYDSYKGPKIAYMVWESTRLPQHFFDRIVGYDEIWVASNWQKECMVKQGMSEAKLQVVPAGVESEVFFPENIEFDEYYKDGRFKFVVFGRWEYRKSTTEIIRTFLATFGRDEPVDLIISVDNRFSQDEFKTTEERLAHFGIEDSRIKILHFTSREDYIKFIKKGHVFLSCARGEGWNLPLIEAMACGTPVIYSNCSGQLEFTKNRGLPVRIMGEKISPVCSGDFYEPDFSHLGEVMRDAYKNYDSHKTRAMLYSPDIRREYSWEAVGEIGATKLKNFNSSRKINAAKKKLKILYIAQHLSTGGAPQYLLKKIQLLNDEFEVYCVEYNFIASEYVVQRDAIIGLLGDRFTSIGDRPKEDLLEIIKNISPDVIHLEEFPESFVRSDIAKTIYRKDRNYLLFESYHGIYFKPEEKVFFPDKFLFVSEYQADIYKQFGVPYSIVEYPIDISEPDKVNSKKSLGLDPEYKHIIQVGLFAPWKNQAETIELARALTGKKVKFHFIGNQASNFEQYWKPIMEALPNNCVIWGERKDVDTFCQAADLMIFPSKMETSPLVIREAISWKLPCLIHNLPAYKNMYAKYSNVKYLTPGDFTTNINLIKSELYL
jgi:glycosyltransferase involved in cell wall biosynthesis